MQISDDFFVNQSSTSLLIASNQQESIIKKVEKLIQDTIKSETFSLDNHNNPDVHLLSNNSTQTTQSISIKEVKGILSQINYKPHSYSHQFAIVLDAEKLTLEAQNAILKTLEEPPAQTVFILGTQNPKMLIQTIVSRCLLIQLEDKQEEKTTFEVAKYLKQPLYKKYQTIEDLAKIKNPTEKKIQINSFLNALVQHYEPKWNGEKNDIMYNLEQIKDTHTALSKNANIKLALESLVINLK